MNTGITRIGFRGMFVSIQNLKTRVSKKFPNSEIANILLSEPDEMSVEELIAKCGTWLSIMDATHNNLNSEYIKGVSK
jgi:hypothetical protein